LKLKLNPEENQKITDHKIDNIQVYEYYLRAKDEILKFSEGSINKALNYLQTALEITGDNALLYAGMALAYWNLVQIGVAHEDYLNKAEVITDCHIINPQNHEIILFSNQQYY